MGEDSNCGSCSSAYLELLDEAEGVDVVEELANAVIVRISEAAFRFVSLSADCQQHFT